MILITFLKFLHKNFNYIIVNSIISLSEKEFSEKNVECKADWASITVIFKSVGPP